MAKKQEQGILGRAMLANIKIGVWEARKNDKQITNKVNTEYAASNEAGRYHKHLFGGPVEELSKLVTASHYLRWTHYAQTLPWSDSGWRLLPTANHMEYLKIMREKRADFDAAVDVFVAAYPRLVLDARAKLNGMYKESDYPSVEAVRRKYHSDLQFDPIPSGEDFRVSLPSEEMKRIAKEVEERMANNVASAMQDAWIRLGTMVEELKSKLENDAKGLRGATLGDAVKVERLSLSDLADVLGRLNLTQDAALEKARKQVQTQLATLNVETLKKDDIARKKATLAVDDILKQVRSVYSPAQEDE